VTVKTFLTTKEVAELLKVNEKMIYSLVNDKGLPATKVTGKWLFPRRLVEEWLDAHILNYRKDYAGLSSEDGVLLLAGSDDPLFQRTLSLFHKLRQDTVAFFSNLGSMGGLTSLRRGLCHIGVCHLLQDDNQEYNFDFAEQELDRAPVFVNFSQREQGILLSPGTQRILALLPIWPKKMSESSIVISVQVPGCFLITKSLNRISRTMI